MDHPKLDFVFDPKHAKILKMRGVDGSLFAGRRNQFNIVDGVLRMKPEIRNMKPKTYGPSRQLTKLAKHLANPLYGNKTIGISSFPSDLHAKLVALNLMRNALADQNNHRHSKIKHQPLWHKIYGGFPDKLRDNPDAHRPCFLVLSNIAPDSTNVKLEKLRDLLEIYHDIPKVVVISGCDPIGFFANRLHMPLDSALYIGHVDRVPDVDILDL